MFVSSVEVTSLRSTSAASFGTGQKATSSRLAGRFSVIGGFVYLIAAPGVAGPFGSLPGSDGLKTYAGSVSCGTLICRMRSKFVRFVLAARAAAASSSLENCTPSSVSAALMLSAVTGPAFCAPWAAAFAARAPATATGTVFRNLRRDSLPDLFGIQFSLLLLEVGRYRDI